MLVELSWRLALRRSCNCGKKTLVLYRRGVRRRPRDCSLGQFRAVLPGCGPTDPPARIRDLGRLGLLVLLCAEEFQIAYELAKAAASHGIPAAGQLSMASLTHATYDRWQLALGKRQTYGTQFLPIPIKRPCPPAQ